MRLTELDPRWLEKDGRRVGLVFRCPHCAHKPLGHGNDAGCYISCFAVAVSHIAGDDQDSQYGLFATVLPEEWVGEVVPCKRGYEWKFTPPIDQASFETLTVQPSLDCSAARHWHGFVTNGEIK